MSTCNKKVQPITSRIITDKDGNKTYESTNPDKIGLLFLNYNEPFCLSYVKDKKKYDPYKLIEKFGWGKDEEKCISQTSNDTYVLNQSTMNSMCQQINKVITETTTSVCNNSTTSISQYNEVKLKDIKCCVDNAPLNCKCNFMISQANKAVLEVNNTFVTNLTKVDIGKNVESIGYWGFHNCSNLTDLTIYSEKLDVNGSQFVNSPLKEVKINESNSKYKVLDGILYSKDGKKIYMYPPAKEGEFTISSENEDTLNPSLVVKDNSIVALNTGGNGYELPLMIGFIFIGLSACGIYFVKNFRRKKQ